MDAERSSKLPEPTFSAKLFAQWQYARRGQSPAEDLSNSVWEWMFRGRVDPYHANRLFATGEDFPSQPRWAGCRMGQSETRLSDGRTIWIAGEHEDFYDPDFFIYNDVIIEHADGRVEIRGYPVEVFPPTDFHSATAIDEERSILIVGSIGYQQSRDEHRTPVYRLNTTDYQIVQVETKGASPGWIHKHTAERSVDGKRLTIRGGEIMYGKGFIESIDDWALCLEQFVWTRLTDRRWPTYQVHREDGKRLHLFEYSSHVFELEHPQFGTDSAERIELEIGAAPALDAYKSLFVPAIAHTTPSIRDESESDNWRTTRLLIDGVCIRFVDDSEYITVVAEGDLETATLISLIEELVSKLASVENCKCTYTRIR